MFTILNNRGVPLTNADILKAINIGEITDVKENKKYAIIWENIEGNLGGDFDRFLSFLRTILVKEKARVGLLEEFEENVYKNKVVLKGKPTIDLMQEYKDIYDQVIKLENDSLSNEFKNLITIMKIGLPSGDWIPPLLSFYNNFGKTKLFPFLKKLEYKFSSDWILQFTPTDRIENMNKILKAIDLSKDVDELLKNDQLFEVESNDLKSILDGEVYKRRFARYILLKFEYLISDNTVHLSNYSDISVEHVLPQSPHSTSQWMKDFTEQDVERWTHRLANLVLINKKKNSKLSNLDFNEKKTKYLESRIDIFHGSKIFIQQSNDWNVNVLAKRQTEILNKLVTV